MQNKTVTYVWVAGLVLAAVIYCLGPDVALDTMFQLADRAAEAIQAIILTLGGKAFDIVRALTIGCFAIFFALSIIAAGRGVGGRWQMLGISLLFLLLVGIRAPRRPAIG